MALLSAVVMLASLSLCSSWAAPRSLEYASRRMQLCAEPSPPGAPSFLVAARNEKGQDPDRPKENQDAWLFLRAPGEGGGGGVGVCCVMDGHGKKGHVVVDALLDVLPAALLSLTGSKELLSSPREGWATTSKLTTPLSASTAVLEDLPAAPRPLPPPGALEPLVSAAFAAAQEALRHATIPFVHRTSGTTAVVAIFDDEACLVANAGDSRAVLGRQEEGYWEAEALSMDSTVADPVERQRVEEAGGRIDPFGNVFHGPIGIAMTRALGDTVMRGAGVLTAPTTVLHRWQQEDAFVLLASDGVFEVLSNQACVQIVGECIDKLGLDKGLPAGIEALMMAASDRWADGLPMEVKRDDMTCVAIAPNSRHH